MRSNNQIGRWDQVRLKTTRNVNYLSAPSGTTVSPKGVWSVIAAVGTELLCARKNAIIRIPYDDVLKIVSYDTGHITKDFGKLSYVQKEAEEANTKTSDE